MDEKKDDSTDDDSDDDDSEEEVDDGGDDIEDVKEGSDSEEDDKDIYVRDVKSDSKTSKQEGITLPAPDEYDYDSSDEEVRVDEQLLFIGNKKIENTVGECICLSTCLDLMVP